MRVITFLWLSVVLSFAGCDNKKEPDKNPDTAEVTFEELKKEYSDGFREIVLDSKIAESSAEIIIANTSVAMASDLLWNY